MTADGLYGPSAIYVAGVTGSFAFPTTEGAYDRTFNDRERNAGLCRESFALGFGVAGRRDDAFVSKLTGDHVIFPASELGNLAASTFLGGCARDDAWALALDGSGNVFVAGYTYSPDRSGFEEHSNVPKTRELETQ